MKICKVKLIKRFWKEFLNEKNQIEYNRCLNIPPQFYNPDKIHVISYDENPLEEGDNIGYCIGTVADDFEFTKDMVEIQKAEAEIFIDERSVKEVTEESELKYKNRKEYLV